ncbi:MAG TPA: Spy/CpxP family protein refolding chaperone [Xanthobacteraceae bacterium]
MNRLILATWTAIALGGATTWAQTPSADFHHSPAAGSHSSERAESTPAVGQSGTGEQQGTGGVPMMSMMGNMPMMPMEMMRMAAAAMGGMATVDHIEGRIAFLRAELRITEAQTTVWNAFADALRANSKTLGDARAAPMPQPDAGLQQAPTITDRLDVQERWLTAQLEATKSIKSALTNLYSALSDDQKKIADEIVPAGLGMGMMAMMGRQMPPGQMMQTGQPRLMQPGGR